MNNKCFRRKHANLKLPRKLGPPESEVMAEINITPLTDVLFVLLVIFFVVSSATIFGFNFRLPEGEPQRFIPKNFPGVVATLPAWTAEKQAILVDSRLVRIQDLPDYFSKERTKFRTQKVVLKVADEVPYETVISVMDAAKMSGLARISLTAPVER